MITKMSLMTNGNIARKRVLGPLLLITEIIWPTYLGVKIVCIPRAISIPPIATNPGQKWITNFKQYLSGLSDFSNLASNIFNPNKLKNPR